jgi:transcriptional regulator with XRE-family HTH domain
VIRYDNVRVAMRLRRRQLQLTQRAVAERMGKTQSTVAMLENGNFRNPGLEMLADWCRALSGSLKVDVDFDQKPSQDQQCRIGNPPPLGPSCECRFWTECRHQLPEPS